VCRPAPHEARVTAVTGVTLRNAGVFAG
jgi:hypothetical protein